MGIRRHAFFVKLHCIFLGAAEHVFLFVDRQLVEFLQVMNPLLGQHPTTTGTGVWLGNEGGLFCLFTGGIANAIDKPGQVTHVVVDEAVQLQLRGKQLAHGIAYLHAGIE